MKVNLVPEFDISYLEEEIFDEQGLLKPMPMKFYSTIPDEHLALCGHRHGIYLFPTNELVEIVRQHIGPRKAIEIGAGNGCLGRALGIPMTDSHLQAREDIKGLYDAIGQPPIKYPKDVIKMDAKKALEHFKPECVVAAWVTQKWHKGLKDGCLYGVNENEVINKVDKYIFIGNFGVHMGKKVMERRGLAIGFAINKDMGSPVIYSRSLYRQFDAVWYWEKIKPGMDREDKWEITVGGGGLMDKKQQAEKKKAFLKDLFELYEKHGLCISHEDHHGAFMLVPYSNVYVDWMKECWVEGPDKIWNP